MAVKIEIFTVPSSNVELGILRGPVELATNAVKSVGKAIQTLSQLSEKMGGDKANALKRRDSFVQVGCYETVHTLKTYPPTYSPFFTGLLAETSRLLVNAYKVPAEAPNEAPVEVGCYMTVHVAPNRSAERVIDRLLSEHLMPRMIHPSLIKMILKNPDFVARAPETKVGCYISVHEIHKTNPVFESLQKIEYAFSPIASVLSYVGRPALNFLGFN